MTRSAVLIRDAVAADIPALVDLWGDVMRRGDRLQQEADVAAAMADCALDESQRMIVAECDGQLAGAAHLRATYVTPLHRDAVVQVVSPHVVAAFRRRGIGTALIDSAVTFAEARGIANVASAAVTGSRDAQRFMARLGMAPYAVLRLAPVHVTRAKLAARRGLTTRATGSRSLSSVLATRRSMRRAQES